MSMRRGRAVLDNRGGGQEGGGQGSEVRRVKGDSLI